MLILYHASHPNFEILGIHLPLHEEVASARKDLIEEKKKPTLRYEEREHTVEGHEVDRVVLPSAFFLILL